jgi:flagellar transcriptional activator FlhD
LSTEARIVNEIREMNLQYLILAQHLIRADRAQATFQLGISEAVADIIDALSPMQLHRVASSNTLMCRVRFDDALVWGLLTNSGEPGAAATPMDDARRLHASILIATQSQEALAS